MPRTKKIAATRKPANRSRALVKAPSTAVTSPKGSYDLDFEDLLTSGRGKSRVRSLILDRLSDTTGRKGKIYYLPFETAEIENLALMRQSNENENIKFMVELLSKKLCTKEGTLVFTMDKLRKVPIDVLTTIFYSIAAAVRSPVEEEGDAEGNA